MTKFRAAARSLSECQDSWRIEPEHYTAIDRCSRLWSRKGNDCSRQSLTRHLELVLQRLARFVLSDQSQTAAIYRSLRAEISRRRNRFDLLQHSGAVCGRRLARQNSTGLRIRRKGSRHDYASEGAQKLSG